MYDVIDEEWGAINLYFILLNTLPLDTSYQIGFCTVIVKSSVTMTSYGKELPVIFLGPNERVKNAKFQYIVDFQC